MSNATFTATAAKIESSLLKSITTKSVVYLRLFLAMGDLTVGEAYPLLTPALQDAIKLSSFKVTISRTKTLHEACVRIGVDTKVCLEENRGLDGARRAMGLDVESASAGAPDDAVTRVGKLLAKLSVEDRAIILLALEGDAAVMSAAAVITCGGKVFAAV